MARLFTQIFNMSVSASYIVLAVLLLRLALKKAPKWITLLLWGTVGVRLICPVTFESLLSLIPSLGQINHISPENPVAPGFTEVSYLNALILRVNERAFDPPEHMDLMRLLLPIVAAVWLLGILVLLVYSVVSYRKLHRSVLTAVCREDNIYQSENVRSPFVFGFVKPKIYLPFNIDERNMAHVVAHERAHIRRLDHLWKPLGFVILAIHWFNPLMWLSYLLFCRDIEFACDEKVIRQLDRSAIADYSQALLSCSSGKPRLAACPLAFGEVGVKQRIRSVLNYRKPAFWVAVLAVVVCLASMVCFFTEPVNVYNMGVQRVSVRRISRDQLEIRIKYSSCYSGYGVRLVTEDEGECIGDGVIDYDGSIGKNRILLTFGDDPPAKALALRYPMGEVVKLTNSPIKILVKRTPYPSDHGFVLYFGTDADIQIEEVSGARLSERGGVIRIPIRIVSKSEP